MEQRGEANLRAYAEAELRLLDVFSPQQQQVEPQEDRLDPSVHNMINMIISDDSEIHSLISSGDSGAGGFKGWEDDDFEMGAGEGIFGLCRNVVESVHSMDCTPVKRARLTNEIVHIEDSPEAACDSAVLTNGDHYQQLVMPQTEEEGQRAVIYDENMLVLAAEEHCCEIIVATNEAFLLTENAGPLNGRASFEVEEEISMDAGGHHVYLSDAAAPLNQQQELQVEDEDVNFVDDAPLEEERPDICQVYDHELEDHDDEEHMQQPEQQEEEPEESILEQELHQLALERQREPEEQQQRNQPIIIASDVEHSSPTEFPVSSSSLPNASDDPDELDDEDPHQRVTASPRKYPPLLKNTLFAEVLDRRLAQPQMSHTEKVTTWCTAIAHDCEAVEDVENFPAAFEQHEAHKHKFTEFRETLVRNLEKISKDIMERAPQRRLLHVLPVEEIIILDDDEDDDCFEVTGKDNSSLTTLIPEEEFEDKADEECTPEPDIRDTQTQTIVQDLVTKDTSTTDLSNCMMPPPQAPIPMLASKPAPAQAERDFADVVMDVMREQVHIHHQQYLEQQKQQVPTDSAELSTSLAEAHQSVAYGEFPNDAMFYEQQEFCNYLGLTELATANAVATAMRELANSTVARRSLRVRPQQQLERMRSDVRGKRRERQQQKKQQKQQQMNTSSELSTEQEEHTMVTPTSVTTLTAERETNLNYASPVDDFRVEQPNGDETKQLCLKPESVEAAFAQVYAAAAPAQAELLETMQKRLREARETKPSIYIVQAMSHAPAAASPVIEAVTFSQLEESSTEEVQTATLPPPPPPPRPSLLKHRKTHNQAVGKARTNPPARRKTTAGGKLGGVGTGVGARVRDLVTRSTTHMNSKLLRNRKINLLKSYALTDGAAQGRNKRLSGGSTGASNRNHTTPKAKKAPADPLDKALPEQHRLQHQQAAVVTPTSSPKKVKGKSANAAATSAKSSARDKHRVPKLSQRGRAKSLPEAPAPLNPPPAEQDLPKLPINTHEFITYHAVVRPPVCNEATRNYVHHMRRTNEEQLQLQQLQPEEVILANSSPYAQLAKPALIYPPPPSRPTQPHQQHIQDPHFSRRRRQVAGTATATLWPDINLTPPGGLIRLTEASCTLRNPLAGKHGKVLYMYYELEQLIVLQERAISFWKYSKVFNVLHKPAETVAISSPQREVKTPTASEHSNNSNPISELGPRWVHLGQVRRTTNDFEVFTPYGNRLCVHNSTPVYIEMRCRPLDHHKREGKLLSLYVNVYYHCEEELRPKMHSVHLDAVNCECNNVIYTSISESRYFVMAWQQELVMGKPRSGICKYSLTPTLDTLASIREFKQLRHELKHIECLTEDRLIGYGPTRVTIWDHRSGDTLMNYDLGCPLGRNLGAMHFPSFDMDQSSLLVLYQHIQVPNKPSELHVIACELSHASPSHRVLHVHRLPSPYFDQIVVAVNTGDHLILKSISDDEIWISAADPRQLTFVASQGQGTQRFYGRQKSQVIEMSPLTLTVDSIANHMLKLATQQQQQMALTQTA